MTDDVPSLGMQTKQLARVRGVVADVLASLPEVEAAFVKVEGSYISVRVSVERVEEELMMRLVEAAYVLEVREPGLSFGILPFEHGGRDVQAMSWLGVGPVYVRAARLEHQTKATPARPRATARRGPTASQSRGSATSSRASRSSARQKNVAPGAT